MLRPGLVVRGNVREAQWVAGSSPVRPANMHILRRFGCSCVGILIGENRRYQFSEEMWKA